jgi:multisubunit Na+/H+ antiporter MnhG subunit
MKNKIILAVVGVLFALFACFVFSNAKSAIHEIVALLSAIITALCLIGYAVLNEIEMAGVAILKELRKEDK